MNHATVSAIRAACLGSLAFLVLGACDLMPAPIFSGSTVLHPVQASLADAASSDAFGTHYAAHDPASALRGRLVVFLPGTASDPAAYRRLLAVPLGLGYHVVSLAYPNQQAVGALAQNDTAAYGPVREEICTGRDASPLVSVAPADAIENRLLRLLQYLARTQAAEGWAGFLDGASPDWGKITVAGYSQGAGHALWLSSTHRVARLVGFSGVVDGRTSDPRQPADWIAQRPSWTTPVADFRFFVSRNDGFFPAISANLESLGLGADGPKSSPVDGLLPPNAEAQTFTASWTLGQAAHASTCEDAATPLLADGSARYAFVWRILFL